MICARMPWNKTGIILEKGRFYRFEARGRWRDGAVPANASGFLAANHLLARHGVAPEPIHTIAPKGLLAGVAG